MDPNKRVVSPESDNLQCGELKYRPSFLEKSKDVDDCVDRANKAESSLVDDVCVGRITSGWIHRILHHVGTVHSRQDGKTKYRFQLKFMAK